MGPSHREVGRRRGDHRHAPVGGRISEVASGLLCCVPRLDRSLLSQSPVVGSEPYFQFSFSAGLAALSLAVWSCFSPSQLVCPRGRASVSVTRPSTMTCRCSHLVSAQVRTLGYSARRWAGRNNASM